LHASAVSAFFSGAVIVSRQFHSTLFLFAPAVLAHTDFEAWGGAYKIDDSEPLLKPTPF
jgi:hypothetical protein